jgi:hypothetical protein
MVIYHASPNFLICKRYYEIFNDPLTVLLSMALIGNDTYLFLSNRGKIFSIIILDSGAWSVVSGRSDLTLERYMAYLKAHGIKFDFYFNFDTDFTDQGFSHNISHQIRLEKAGTNPIPVVHNFYDEEIDVYIDRGYEKIALGSKQATSVDVLAHAVDRIKTGNPDVEIHWFGGSTYDWLIDLPIASCDTTSWAKTGAYGEIQYWNDHKKGENKTDTIYVGGRLKEMKEDYHYVDYPWRDELDNYMRTTFGFEEPFAALTGYGDKENMQLVNLRYYVELERRINDERIKRGVPLK